MLQDAKVEDWVVIASLASPHLLYAFIWFNSDTWRKWFGKSSVDKFESVAWLLKGGLRLNGSRLRMAMPNLFVVKSITPHCSDPQ